MKTLDLKREVEKLSGDFTIATGDIINTPSGQHVTPARAGLLEDVAIRNIDIFRSKDADESRAIFALGKKIKEASGAIEANDTEFAFLEKVYTAQIAPIVAAFFDMVEELN